jgi:hypothetical protein
MIILEGPVRITYKTEPTIEFCMEAVRKAENCQDSLDFERITY